MLAAYNKLINEGLDLGWYYSMYVHPMPEEMLKALREKDLVIVPELNYMGQFATVLRSEGIKAVAITQYTGLPFKVGELATRVKDLVTKSVAEGVSV